jgi:hypothetical protein
MNSSGCAAAHECRDHAPKGAGLAAEIELLGGPSGLGGLEVEIVLAFDFLFGKGARQTPERALGVHGEELLKKLGVQRVSFDGDRRSVHGQAILSGRARELYAESRRLTYNPDSRSHAHGGGSTERHETAPRRAIDNAWPCPWTRPARSSCSRPPNMRRSFSWA